MIREPGVPMLPALKLPPSIRPAVKRSADELLADLIAAADLARIAHDADGDIIVLLLLGLPEGLFRELVLWRAEQEDMEPDDPPEVDPDEDDDPPEDNGDAEPTDFLE